MKLRTLVSALLVCAVAPFARGATANSPTPANYSVVPTHTPTLKEFLAKKSKASEYYPTGMFFKSATTGTDARIVLGNDYKTNGIVRLSWKGTTGESTVIITRLSDNNVRTLTTTGTSVDFDAPDIGRNYMWTVKNGSNTAGPWYFYTEDEAPRIIPQRLAVVGNCRDMGGWKTADGKYRVRQGLGYRNDHNADFAKYEQLKPFWTDIAKVRTDMDLRDTLGSTRWYCNYELDENDMHYGRSPYGANWWSVTYWNIVRENDYGGYMLAYKPLVDKRTGMAKYSASTWKLFSSVKNLPIVVHCSQGRDRTGTVAFVLLGALGVPLNDLYADWALTDYAAPKDFPTGGTAGEREIIALYNAINSVYTNAKGYTNLQAKCEKLLSDLGVDASQITALKSLLLEPVEAPITSAADLDGRTVVTAPKLSGTSFKQDGNLHKPTVTVDTTKADVDFGKGNYKDYGHYRVKVTLKDPNTTKWSDGTIGQKDFDVFVYHSGNVFSANVQSFIKGDTSKRIRIARPRYMAQVTCNYTEEQLNNLAPGTYTASFTAKTCPLATSNTSKSKFTVYPATEKPAYIYPSATLDQAFCKTDYVPALKTDKVVMRIEDLADGLGGGYFQSGNYPAVMCMFKLSAGAYRFHQGTQNTGFSNFTWAQNKLYELTIQGKTGSLKEINKTTDAPVTTKSATVTLDSVTATPGSAFIGTSLSASVDSGVEGTPEYHAKHRFYSLKVYANGTKLTHEFVPCETASGKAMIYDKVTGKLYPFSNVSGGSEGKVTLEGEKTKIGGDDPVVDPTEPDPTVYGAADTAASTYTWKGGNGPWEYTTNWTASTGAKYGIPSHATYATADFPATVTKATECTLTSDRSVSVVKFDSPNLALTLNNAKLTVAGWINDDRIGAFNFGDTASGNSTLTLSGSKAALVATRGNVRANFGSQKSGTTGSCTVKFVVPATGWESTAPIRETGSDAKVCFWYNVRFDIDARALGVPADGVVKRVLLASSTDGIRFYGDDEAVTFAHSTILCADGAKGELAVDGNTLVLKVTGDSTPQVEPTPTPSSLFDAAHTIVCYGDSLTWGESSAEITMDSRANYHDGRLAGVAKTPQSYPYWLSGLIPASYNVINQSRSGSQTCNITSWSGEQAVMVEQSFTLPAVGSVSISKNLSFKNPSGWGKWGGWVDIEGYDQSVVDRWSGFVPPIYPLMEKYDANRTRYSVTGTLAGRRVRLQGMHPTNITVTVFGEGTAQTVAAGTEFVPDNESVSPYKDAIRIICTGANDANDDYIGQRYATHIKPLLQAFAAKGGKYLIVSPSVNMGGTGATATTIEKQMASDFGNHYLNLRMAMETNGLATATALGVPFTGKWTATDGTGLKGKGDTVHFNEKGYKVMAEFIRQKLVALGYIVNDEPPPVDPIPEPTPTSKFDSDHTIVCYGDSLTWGTAAKEITMDNRPNYHDGRLAGVSEVPESYTYWLSGLLTNTYNVINQSREGSPASHMTAWSGESEVVVDRSFVLPATGSVSIPTNLVFTSDCPWGKWGRWVAYPQKGEEKDSIEHWSGFATPIFPLYEPYEAGKTRYSITGTLCGRHVRVQGLWPTETVVTVFGTGTAQTVPVGAKFVPDNATLPLYTQGIRILCGSGNDGYRGYNSSVVTDKSGKTIDGGFAKYAKPYFDAFAAKGGKYLIVSQCCQTEDPNLGETQYQNSPTDMETKMAAAYGRNYLNLRMAFMTNGVETAQALGVWPAGSAKPWYDPSTLFHDGTHFTSAGYKVMAEFIRRKLVELGYVEGGDEPTPPPVTMKDYYASKSQTISTYQSTALWFKNAACTTKWSAYPNAYDAAVHFAPNSDVNQILVLDDNLNAKAGEVVFAGNASLRYGTQTFQNNTTTPKAIWSVMSGEAGAVCQGLVLTGTGTGYVDIRGNASAAFTTATLSDNLSIRFNPSDCANAKVRFDSTDGHGLTTFAALTGGAAAATQGLTVENAFAKATSTTVPSGVAGKLEITVKLGDKNTATTDAPLTFAGTFKVNAGSTLAVDAGGKSAGTYPLIAAGTLTDSANLAGSATVSGVASGFKASVAKSGNKINLVIEKIDEPTPPPPGPVDPEAVSTNAMAIASWGYEIHGLGAASNEVALVFTNCDASAGMSWKVPDGVTSCEFLVVGGGGGGASSFKAQRAGGGGGAGGVVYGTATALTAGAQLSIDVGAGGKGGVYTNKYPQCSAGDGGNSSIVCQDTTWVTAFGGGHGAHVNYSGAAGGSGGGAGCNNGTSCAGGAATAGSVAQLAFLQAQTFGNRGGANWTSTAVAVAGGGGGAGAQGADATSSTSGAGGDGKAFDITGESVWYAGGGGAGVSSSKASDARSGGNGGGGHGGAHTSSATGVAAENGTNGLGGGGGGAGYYQSGKAGGSGVVIIRYVRAGGEEPQPVVDPTKYGEADKSAATYTWKGPSGMWNHTTSWTPSTASATYGIPNNKANATAEFPATLTSAFTCTVTNNMTVDFAKFDSPNMTLVLDNASLTCNDRLDLENYGSYYFGNGPTGDATIEFRGANAALVSTKESIRAQFGCLGGEATGVCTLRFVVPASGWTKTTAPVRTGGDSKVFLNANVRLDIDATALGVPTAGQTKTAILVASSDGIIVRPADLGAVSTIVCAQGARGELVLEDSTGSHFKTLKLVVSPDSTPLALALTAPTANATDVAVIRPAQAAFFALDRDARWAQVDDRIARDAMVDASSFPQDVEFAWQGGTAPYAFTLTRNRDGKAVKTVENLAAATVSVGNLETGRAYTWTVTDAAGKSVSRSFTTAYADQRFLRVPAANAYNAVKGFASKESADVHKGYLPNFRDLGGMFTADGTKRVKQGVAYRSFCFDSASTPSLDVDTAVVVGELGVKTDLDLRGSDEIGNIKDGKSPLGADVTWVNCPTKPYGIDKLGEADAAALRVFKDPAKLPVVFHCSAGQDRTGTLAMMLGAILDLDEEDIEKGWSASCFFQNGMDQDDGQGHVDTGFQTHRVKTFFGDYAKYGQPGDTFAACVRAALKAKLGMTEDDFAAIRANLLEEDTEVTRPVKATVEVPEPNAIAREYDGTVQTTYLRTNPRYTVAMAADAVDPGDYPVTLKLVDPGVCAWADGTVDDKTVIFTITGEKPTEDDGPVPSFNASTGELTFSNGVQYVYLADKAYTPSKAIFEPGASILANGADVSIDKVYLQGAGNAFTAEGIGSVITLTPYQKSTVAANTSVSFAADGGIISVGKTAGGDEWTLNKSGMTLSVSALNNAYIGLSGVSFTGKVLMDATDSTVKFNDFTVAAAGSEIGLTNSTLKTNWNVTMGETAAATVTLAGVAPLMQAANGPLTLGKNLTVKLVPELDWPEDQGRFHSIGSGTYATVTLASGVKFDVDVSKFAGLTTNVTFCLLSAPNTQTPSIALPTAANVKVSGEGAENCTVAFTKSDDGRRVYVTVNAAGKLYPDWIGAGDEANRAKFDAWVEKFGVSDRPGANETAYLLNCAATDEAIETALEAFKIPSIAVTDGVVEVGRPVHPEPGADFNGEVVIRGSATVTGDYELSEDSEDARFYKAFLGYAE